MWIKKERYYQLMMDANPPPVFITTGNLDFLTGAADTCIKCPKCMGISFEDANFCEGCGSKFVKGWVEVDVVNAISETLDMLGAK